jgi:hypothetical protein
MTQCPHCGGDESMCDFDHDVGHCSQMDRGSNACPYSDAEIERSQRMLAAILGEDYDRDHRHR